MTAIARRLDATEGQVWTLAIGLVLATVLALAGIPPVVHHRHVVQQAPLAAASSTPVTQPAAVAPAPVTASQPSAALEVPPAALGAEPATGGADVAAPAPPPFTTVATSAVPLAGVAVVGGLTVVGTDDSGPSRLLVYDGSGQRVRELAVAGQPKHVRGITALAADGTTVVAADAAGSRVLRVDPSTGRQTTVATVPDLPSCVLAPGAPACEPGLQDHAPTLTGVAVAADGDVFVADAAQATVWRIHHGQATVWSQSGTGGPQAVAVAPDGSVVYSVGTDLSPSNPVAASVYRVSRQTNGSAGQPALLAKLARGDQPTGIAIGRDGRVSVALQGASAVVVLDAAGGFVQRLADPALGAPIGVAIDPGGLVATSHPAGGGNAVVRLTTS